MYPVTKNDNWLLTPDDSDWVEDSDDDDDEEKSYTEVKDLKVGEDGIADQEMLDRVQAFRGYYSLTKKTVTVDPMGSPVDIVMREPSEADRSDEARSAADGRGTFGFDDSKIAVWVVPVRIRGVPLPRAVNVTMREVNAAMHDLHEFIGSRDSPDHVFTTELRPAKTDYFDLTTNNESDYNKAEEKSEEKCKDKDNDEIKDETKNEDEDEDEDEDESDNSSSGRSAMPMPLVPTKVKCIRIVKYVDMDPATGRISQRRLNS